jgi:hypothetical protein
MMLASILWDLGGAQNASGERGPVPAEANHKRAPSNKRRMTRDAHVHESAQRFHESAQPWSCPAGAALEVVTHTAPRGGVRDRRLTLVAF